MRPPEGLGVVDAQSHATLDFLRIHDARRKIPAVRTTTPRAAGSCQFMSLKDTGRIPRSNLRPRCPSVGRVVVWVPVQPGGAAS